MFSTMNLGRLFGIKITIHWSLLVFAGFIVALDSRKGGFDSALETATILIGVFGSVLAHEFGHVFASRYYGINTSSINLSILGGMAFLERFPDKTWARVVVALSGPLVSLILAVVFAVWAIGVYGPEGVKTAVGTISIINAGLLLFNLLPIYPLDGGRVLNAVNAKIFSQLTADKVSFYTGQWFSVLMFAYGTYKGDFSLMMIAGFILLVTASEFNSKPLCFYSGKKKSESPTSDISERVDDDTRDKLEAENDLTYGIFVAFDDFGRHFAYARHWKDFDDAESQYEQRKAIQEYETEARNRGGEVRLLTPIEYQRIVVAGNPA